ncbi:hypothetical protein [Glycomyces tenuis]|uniref:hypothetical protein n=3 Tax=Glycomyces tenuis TaxID=58116 RepID=UPI0004180BC7|nr:hypothetical protein [Glycomyces tenuis]
MLALSVLSWPSASAAQEDAAGEEIQFEYGIDGVSWYWSRQIDETLELGQVVQPIELPNPQSATTMPVAVEFGEASKVAALQFNLMERGVPEGAGITDFTLTVAEGDDAGDAPTFNPAQHLIQACPITEAWSPGEAEMWDVQPPVGDNCVKGERAEPDPEEVAEAEGLEDFQVPLPTWTFDLSELAEDWAVDHFANYGVMFMPVLDDATPIDLWQVNLKLPLRDDAETETDEYEATVDRLGATLAYEPPAETVPTEDSGGATSGGVTGGGGGGSGGGGSAGGSDAEAPAEEAAATEEIAPAAYEPIEPRMPWYVWTLIPAGLVGAYILHTLMGGTAAPVAARGAIDRIRSHNLARRGWSLPVPAGLFERLTGRGGREAG